MLNKKKKLKLISALKNYSKKFLHTHLTELDESGTRLMINSFLTDVLEYTQIEEIKTEYMIKGTYADYVVQIKGIQHFLVEVKALSLNLSDKHLRQAVNYGANEGIDWVLLTNGKNFDFYKIIFGKPIDARKIFSIDLSNKDKLHEATEFIEFLHRDSVIQKGLKFLWNKTIALDPEYISGLLYDKTITNFIKRSLKNKFKAKFTDEEVHKSITKIIADAINIEKVKIVKPRKDKTSRLENNEIVNNQNEMKSCENLSSVEMMNINSVVNN